MIKRTAVIAALVLSGAMMLGCSSGKESGEFLKKAAQGGMTEVQLGRLAQERASTSAVKQFG